MASASQPTPLPNAWLRFWFTPKDPTMLGLMRLCSGALFLYLLFAMSFDLTEGYGPNAWWSHEAINKERKEIGYIYNRWSWEPTLPNIRLPDAQHRRDAVVEFLRKLPSEQTQREQALEYLARLVPNDSDAMRAGLSFLDLMPVDDEDRAARLDLILTVPHTPENPSTEVPPFITILPKEKRVEMRKAVERILDLLPADKQARSYIVQYFVEMAPDFRTRTLELLLRLPADSAERNRIIDYINYWNLDPAQTYVQGRPVWSTWFHLQSLPAMIAVHVFSFVVVALFTVGYYTRITSVLAWLVLLNMIHRSQQLLFGMDTMLNILMVYLTIGPSGAALSLDRLREVRKIRAEIAAGKRSATDPETVALLHAPAKSMLAGFVTRLFQIHFCFIYTASGMSKLKGDAWWNHTALWRTLVNPEFSPFPVLGYRTAVDALASSRFATELFSASGIVFTFALELALVCLVWTKARPYVVIGGLLLHFSIAIFMGLTVFCMLMMTLLLSYLQPEVVRETLGWTNPPRQPGTAPATS
ncbi:HTTM domain-containing protein [Tuwongella immobilis]|uniref:HTTM-like domain-containing protein n=1 Tax=Tuwongella immobilis TaxID=692036 RepID=A0A6C2YTR5_9BACT|nr:HTTM domain-containing protein [Tuwongella immobilis]VIP04814.1 httm domain protein : Uncharacterized protein OS=uncultured bacterium A1Q1_fos_962 PE=4 SV=1 [Tuwongella immobilis]VTS06988.1 httm domain protein : Uncharacterized protein OS=uncultured bacterium A1Q1_fos_962 PE=4 SV=1 [Tuwongella immobilis]